MRRILFLISALVFSFALILSPGCGGDDDDNPGGPGDGDTLSTEQVLTALEDLSGAFDAVYDECEASYIINGLLDEDAQGEFLLLTQVLFGVLEGDAELADFYGTWGPDTSTVNPLDMVIVDSEPDDAVVIPVTGIDTLGGANYPGDITIYDLVLGTDLDTVFVHVALHVDGSGDSVAVLLNGSLNQGELSLSGNACDLEFEVNFTLDEADSSAAVSGWYDSPGDPKVYFEIAGSLSGDTTSSGAEGSIHIWTTEAPTVDVTLTITDDPTDCLTGTIKINGTTEATMYADDCSADTVNIYVVIDGQTYSLEDLLGEFYSDLLGLNLDDLGSGGLIKQAFLLTPRPLGKSAVEAFERLVQ
ncbi:MAG: hypothetical protein ABIK65_12335 [Candidatus Eisenbacteria bacterium]